MKLAAVVAAAMVACTSAHGSMKECDQMLMELATFAETGNLDHVKPPMGNHDHDHARRVLEDHDHDHDHDDDHAHIVTKSCTATGGVVTLEDGTEKEITFADYADESATCAAARLLHDDNETMMEDFCYRPTCENNVIRMNHFMACCSNTTAMAHHYCEAKMKMPDSGASALAPIAAATLALTAALLA